MFATQCRKFRLDKGLSHRFNVLSGWCEFGCGNREDGHITTREGSVIDRGPTYSATDLAEFAARANAIVGAR